MTVHLFRIDVASSRALAAICPQVRYAAILASRQRRPTRLQLSSETWLALGRELSEPLPASALPADQVIVQVLVDRESRASSRVRYVVAMPIDASTGDLQARLDALLVGPRSFFSGGRLGWWQ